MRARRLEAALFTSRMPGFEPKPSAQPGVTHRNVPANPEVAMLRAFFDNAKEFDNLRRYTTPIERAFLNAIAELTKLQKKENPRNWVRFAKQQANRATTRNRTPHNQNFYPCLVAFIGGQQ